MKRWLTYIVVLLAGALIGWMIGSMAQRPAAVLPARPAVPTAPDAVRDAPGADPEVARLRERIAELERLLAEAQARPAAPESPVRVAGESGDPEKGTLRVIVTDEAGSALPDRRVRSGVQGGAGVDILEAMTGADGMAMFAGLAAGRRTVFVEMPGGLRVIKADVVPGRVVEVRFVVSSAGTPLSGTVRDVDKGALANVRVHLYQYDRGTSATDLFAVTDEEGRYRFESVPPGSWETSVSSGNRSKHDTIVVVPGGAEVTKDFLFGVGGLKGRTLDRETGRPVPGVSIQVQEGGWRNVTSDADGFYRLEDVEEAKLALCVSRDGYGVTFLRDVAVPAEGREMDIELSPAATVVFNVTGPAGRPYVGSLFLGISSLVREEGTNVGTNVSADADGKAVYRMILPGRYRLTLKADGVGEAQVEAEVRPGENRIEVALKAE